jgi:very-short-patch-repair endonuclease
LRFRRQHPVGPYILDFYCPSARLAIEIDGTAHDFGDRPQRDDARDAWLVAKGIGTLRIPAADVMSNLEGTTRLILARCAPSPPPASPVPLPI